LDALLHDSTIRWINEIVGETGHLTWNSYKTYAHNTVSMMKYDKKRDPISVIPEELK
jgi:hypothetical protein